jgi:hypothetical protein
MTSFAPQRSCAVASTSVNFASPSNFIASPLGPVEVPKPPSTTEIIDRFIA